MKTQPDGQDLTYSGAAATFQVQQCWDALEGSPEGGLNASIECCDRHCGRDRVALRWIAADGHLEEFTFEQLRDKAAKFANVLTRAGIGPGDVVGGMLPRTPELVVAILGTWRVGAAYQPLFTAFGPKAIEHRLKSGNTKLVVTNSANRGKLADIPDCPRVATVVGKDAVLPDGDIDFTKALEQASSNFAAVMRAPDDLMLMMSTSGTTGSPKGVAVPNKALTAFLVYMRDAVDLRPDDVFWNIADPGWAYGLYYAVTGPLLMGCATTLSEAPFDAENFYRIVQKLKVSSVAGAPTAFRMLMAAGPDLAQQIKGIVRVVSSAGEPLNPEVIRWFNTTLGVPVYDHYGQTEVGMVVNNHHRLKHAVREGAAGFAMPGYRVAILDDAGRECAANQPGTLAVDIARSPLLFFGGYHNAQTPAISGGYYRTGDTAEMQSDGSVTFIGRDDDVITSSGYRIGPFEVESALLEHQAVVEAAVVGVPDAERTEIVKAFVVLADGVEATEDLAEELKKHVRNRLSAHAYPRLITFVGDLPKTPSGKIQRFLLRNPQL